MHKHNFFAAKIQKLFQIKCIIQHLKKFLLTKSRFREIFFILKKFKIFLRSNLCKSNLLCAYFSPEKQTLPSVAGNGAF